MEHIQSDIKKISLAASQRCRDCIGRIFVVSFLVTPTYKSTATFYVYNSSNGVSTSGEINNNDLQAAESLASTYSKIFQSNAVLDSVLQDLNYKNKLSRKELSEMVDVSIISDTQLLELSVTSPDPEFS
ncbi:MAG: Wzz/FepE/Etk N-terminal domain-containing protein [Oscillospiraceae bacterium]|nr:Wzz/FepE/Etk N-terminal domain-containing protein [Oscillospiraceae bacterium]